MSPAQKPGEAVGSGFETTHWTIIHACAGTEGRAHLALSELCRAYWQPIYAHLRHQGQAHHDAQDLAQQFFEDFLGARDTWAARVDQGRGRFRSYLLASLRNFLRSDATRRRAIKRGGGMQIVPLDTLLPAEILPAAHPSGVDLRYDRDWAVALTNTALQHLQDEFAAQRKGAVFDVVKPYLVREDGDTAAADAAAVGISVNAFQVLVHRTRRQYGVHLRRQVARTVSSEEAVDEELRYLRRVMFNAE